MRAEGLEPGVPFSQPGDEVLMLNDEMTQLRELIERKALTIHEQDPFKLASGNLSKYIFDMKKVSLDPFGVNLIGKFLFEKMKNLDIEAVGGLESGAIPVVTAIVSYSGNSTKPLSGFYVRKEPKERGTRKLIEGNLAPGQRVVLVDDVTTKGGSVGKAIEDVRNFGCEVVKVFTVVDRQAGAKERMEKMNVDFEALFVKSDFKRLENLD